MKALILVDLQNDFLPTGALPVRDGDAVITVANRLQGHFARVFATQDWHPPDHGSFAANHSGKAVGEEIELSGVAQTLWPVHCVQGTPGARFAPGLDTTAIEKVFEKGVDPEVDSYSGFFDAAARRATGLGDHLRAIGVDEVYILGLATDYCVKFTVLDALALGFRTFVITDGCRAVDLQPGDGERAFGAMAQAGAVLTSSSDLLPQLPWTQPAARAASAEL